MTLKKVCWASPPSSRTLKDCSREPRLGYSAGSHCSALLGDSESISVSFSHRTPTTICHVEYHLVMNVSQFFISLILFNCSWSFVGMVKKVVMQDAVVKTLVPDQCD